MTAKQQELIDALAALKIDATFNGRFLNCCIVIKKTSGRRSPNRFGIVFDDPATLDGPRVTSRMSGAYAEHFAREAFGEAIRVGQGQEAADRFEAECERTDCVI